MATSYLHRTPGGASNQTTWTFSTWFKRGIIPLSPGMDNILSAGTDASNYMTIGINTNGKIAITQKTGGTNVMDLDTSSGYKFRDVGAWYHVVLAVDTTQTTNTDRVKLYINGTLHSWLGTTSYPAEDLATWVNSTSQINVGYNVPQGSGYWTGLMAHTHLCDGTQYAASYFGEFDATSGIWVSKSAPSVTYGTNGFFLKYGSGAITTDSSGEGNTMTQVGTITPTKDNAANNFCTMNPLDDYYVDATWSAGNNQVVIADAIKTYATSTMGVGAGKWYWEVKMSANTGADSNYQCYGIADRVSTSATTDAYAAGYPANYIYESNGRFVESETENTEDCPDTYTTGDIMMFALDLTNDKIYYGKNGTWQCSGDPTSGATGTGAEDIKGTGDTDTSGFYFPMCGSTTTSKGATWQFNFGNGYFGTTLDATETDDAGIGLFKYDVPAGYYALCTNNLGDQS